MDYVGLGVVFAIIVSPLLFWIIKEAVKCGIIEAYKIIKNSYID